MSATRSWKIRAKAFVARWASEESGQDLIEYMLLGATLAFAGFLGLNAINSAMATTYDLWDQAVQSDALVEVPDPVEE